MGDKLAEQMAILTLKSQITRPLNYNAPIENNWYMGRTWADIWDKHYSLFSTNQHPLQLESYQQYNDYTKGLHDKAHMGQISSIADRVKEVWDKRSAALDKEEGESLSIDDYTDIYIQVMGEYREKNNLSRGQKDKNGEYADYLETRRPFGTAQ